MHQKIVQRVMIEEMLQSLEIPDTAYKKAIARYADLGEWFGKEDSRCSGYSPSIYAQGSFRLGTVVRPILDEDSYDLDVGCRLTAGIDKRSHTQHALKQLVKADLEAYRIARKIENQLEEPDRCWRLNYADELSFHMDVVPSIPEEQSRRGSLLEAMTKQGAVDFVARSVANHMGAITDKSSPNFDQITDEWPNSNSEGFAVWFDYRMRLAATIEKRALLEAKAAEVKPLPTRHWNSPLQQSVKLLKRHRDILFQNNKDSQPASIIITTLAAHAYEGEVELQTALMNIVSRMRGFVQKSRPRIANPVNPEIEDFADKWSTPKGIKRKLEDNFWYWLDRAETDFAALGSSNDTEILAEVALSKFGVRLNAKDLVRRLEILGVAVSMPKSSIHMGNPSQPVDLRGGGRHG